MEVFLILFMFIVTLALTVFAVYAIIKEMKKNKTYSTYSQTEHIHPEAVKCPYCEQEMVRGYAIALRGLAFRKTDQKRSSIVINRLLSNTMNYTFGIKENLAWHCSNCNITTIDHSSLVGIK